MRFGHNGVSYATDKEPKYHRRSIRLQGWDYAQPGAYFVTVVAHGRELLFGQVVDDEIRLSQFGEIAHDEWLGHNQPFYERYLEYKEKEQWFTNESKSTPRLCLASRL